MGCTDKSKSGGPDFGLKVVVINGKADACAEVCAVYTIPLILCQLSVLPQCLLFFTCDMDTSRSYAETSVFSVRVMGDGNGIIGALPRGWFF